MSFSSRIARIAANAGSVGEPKPIQDVIADPGFPASAVGRLVNIRGAVGRVLDVSAGDEDLIVEDIRTGEVKKFRISVLARIAVSGPALDAPAGVGHTRAGWFPGSGGPRGRSQDRRPDGSGGRR